MLGECKSEVTVTVYKPDPEETNSLGSNWIQAILEDDSGMRWIGTSDGLDRYDRALDQFTHYRNDPQDRSRLSNNEITAPYLDQSSVLWIGTGGGLDRYDRENERFVHYQNDPGDPHSLSSNFFTSIVQDQKGSLWIGTGGGVDKLVLSEAEGFDPGTERFSHYREKEGVLAEKCHPHRVEHVDAHIAKGAAALLDETDAAAADAARAGIIEVAELAPRLPGKASRERHHVDHASRVGGLDQFAGGNFRVGERLVVTVAAGITISYLD